MLISSNNNNQAKNIQSKTPDNFENEGPDGPNREVSDDGIWNFGKRDGFEGCSVDTRSSSSDYSGCGDSGGSGGGAFLG
jgi:hypothetical protein